MSLSALSLSSTLLLDLGVSNERDAILRTCESLRENPEITNFPGFVDAVFDRQRINPPILCSGIALPHARTPLVREIVCAVSRTAEPVAFGPEGVPVRLIFIFGIPPHRISEYLAVTAALVKRLRNPEVTAGLLNAGNADDFLKWLE